MRTNKFEEARIWLSEYGARFDRTLPSLLKDLDDAGVLACILQLNGEFMESLTVLILLLTRMVKQATGYLLGLVLPGVF